MSLYTIGDSPISDVDRKLTELEHYHPAKTHEVSMFKVGSATVVRMDSSNLVSSIDMFIPTSQTYLAA